MMIRNEIQGGELWKLNKMGGGSTAAAPQKSIADFAPEARTHKTEKTDDMYPKGTGSTNRSCFAGPTAEAPPAAEEARLWQGSGPRFMA